MAIEESKLLNCAEEYEELSDLELEMVAGGKGGDGGGGQGAPNPENVAPGSRR